MMIPARGDHDWNLRINNHHITLLSDLWHHRFQTPQLRYCYDIVDMDQIDYRIYREWHLAPDLLGCLTVFRRRSAQLDHLPAFGQRRQYMQ